MEHRAQAIDCLRLARILEPSFNQSDEDSLVKFVPVDGQVMVPQSRYDWINKVRQHPVDQRFDGPTDKGFRGSYYIADLS